MREPYEIIIAPVVTEKSAGQMEGSTYSFVVAKDANKIEIGHAVEKLWDVTVKDVRTMRYAGKAKRAFMGRMSRGAGMGPAEQVRWGAATPLQLGDVPRSWFSLYVDNDDQGRVVLGTAVANLVGTPSSEQLALRNGRLRPHGCREGLGEGRRGSAHVGVPRVAAARPGPALRHQRCPARRLHRAGAGPLACGEDR